MSDEAPAKPTARTVLRSTVIAFFAAALATVLFVLPAEYGIDPTGAGGELGLLALYQADETSTGSEGPREITRSYPGKPDTFDYYDPEVLGEPWSVGHDGAFRSDTIVISLDEFEQVEYKAVMRQGDAIVYSWSVDDGIVYADFHADPGEDAEGYPDQYFIRYRESEAASDSGSLVAPFDGNHGWYWLNIEEHPISITLEVSGYYERVDELFRSFQ